MSSAWMAGILAAFGALSYLAAPFLGEEKKALRFRLIGEGLLGLSFLYEGNLTGLVYYGFLVLSAVFEKQIETKKWFSLVYGSIAAAVTLFINNNGTPGIVLALSLIIVFVRVDEEKQMMTAGYLDALSALALLYYAMRVKAWVVTGLAVLLLVTAIAGLISSVKLARAGGMEAAAYQKQKAAQQNHKKKKKNKKL